MRSRRRRRTTIGTGERAAWKRRKGETEGEVDRERSRERTRRTRRGREKERETEDTEEQGEGEGGQGRLGWPKVARVEYWNALPEAISVRCPPFVLLSCPLQASSSFPTPLFLSVCLLFSLFLRFASSRPV